jgi:hypothetical protein
LFLEGFFSSLIRFQESPASVAVRAQVDYIRDDRFVMQCSDCKKITLNEVRFFIVHCDMLEIFRFQEAESCFHCNVGVLTCRPRLWITAKDSLGAMRQLCLYEVCRLLIFCVVKPTLLQEHAKAFLGNFEKPGVDWFEELEAACERKKGSMATFILRSKRSSDDVSCDLCSPCDS